MNVAHWHLIIVHVPVVGMLWTMALLLTAEIAKSELLRKIALVSLAVCAITAAIAYFTGIGTANLLDARYAALPADLIETHGLWGRGAFVLTMVLGVGAISALLQYAQEERPARWLRLGLLAGVVVCAGVLAYTAHQGGMIRHPEARGESRAGAVEFVPRGAALE